MNITLDDACPQFQFVSPSRSDWSTNHTSDRLASQYSDGTFHGTTASASMTLTFNGTAVYVYGGKRPNHGLYSTQLDNGNLGYQSGFAAPDQLQQLLYSATGLSSDKQHTLQMINAPDRMQPPPNATLQYWLDIDYAIITTPTTGQIYKTEFDDLSDAIQYDGTGWGSGPPLSPQLYYNNTAHITANIGDSLTFRFNGSSVQLYGGLYVDHGNYSVSLDGVSQGVFNGTAFQLQTNVPLFVASSLVDGPHKVVVTNVGQGLIGSYLDFDYAVVNSNINPTAAQGASSSTNTTSTKSTSSTTSSTTSGSSSTGSKHIDRGVGAIAGGVVGGVAGLFLVAIIAWYFLHHRRRKLATHHRSGSDVPLNLTGDEVKPYALESADSPEAAHTLSGTYDETLTSSQPRSTTKKARYATPAREPENPRTPFLTAIPPPPASNAASYVHSDNHHREGGEQGEGRLGRIPRQSTTGLQSSSKFADQRVSSTSLGYLRDAASRDRSSAVRTSGISFNIVDTGGGPPKATYGLSPSTPRASTATTASTPRGPREETVQTGRLRRLGRAMDMGPVPQEREQADPVAQPPAYEVEHDPLLRQNQ